jgi:hypothetical protein
MTDADKRAADDFFWSQFTTGDVSPLNDPSSATRPKKTHENA